MYRLYLYYWAFLRKGYTITIQWAKMAIFKRYTRKYIFNCKKTVMVITINLQWEIAVNLL